jgi:hypothetical protein
VVNAFEHNAGTLYPLVLALPDWKLVYEDPQALVLVRDLPPGMPPWMPAVPARQPRLHATAAVSAGLARDVPEGHGSQETEFRRQNKSWRRSAGQRRLNAIVEARKVTGVESLTHPPIVRNTMKGIRRTKAPRRCKRHPRQRLMFAPW